MRLRQHFSVIAKQFGMVRKHRFRKGLRLALAGG
jgi:hypothetical protein